VARHYGLRVHSPEFMSVNDGPLELRVTYALNDQGNADAYEMHVVTVDPELSERATVPVPTQVGVTHEGVDEDGDGVADWIPAYELQAYDPGGTWRALWIGADECGLHSPHRRTHDRPRMLVANGDTKSQMNYGLVYEGYHTAKEKTYEGYEDPRPVTAVQIAALDAAGYELPSDRKMDEGDDGEEFVERWIGLRSWGGFRNVHHDWQAFAMEFNGHCWPFTPYGEGLWLNQHWRNRYCTKGETTQTGYECEVERWRHKHGECDRIRAISDHIWYKAKWAHFLCCLSGQDGGLAPYVVGSKGYDIAAAMGYTGKVATGYYDEWTDHFHGLAKTTTLGAAYSATRQWVLNLTPHPPHQDYPDGHWGFSTAKFFGRLEERLQIAEP